MGEIMKALAELSKYQIPSECVNNITAELTIEALTLSRHSTGNFIRLLALHGRPPLLQKDFLVLISVRSLVDPRSIMQLQGLDLLKNPMTLSGYNLWISM
jgi:hypothetical protein